MQKNFSDNDDDDDLDKYKKVSDHCHYTGKFRFRRAAIKICNLRYKTP